MIINIYCMDYEMYQRILKLKNLLNKKSFFLFGPRSIGKTTLIHQQIPQAKNYDLLDAEIYRMLLKRPKIIEEECAGHHYLVVIDEIQKLPLLLDEVQRLILKYDMILGVFPHPREKHQ